ncbi:response regulator [Nonlabens antarcticus]|uniref:response regulator n=1 Tax=Nonlabens antarcticus TaxID=392714 RepID=UPI001891BEB6|nr:response regulator [Nonlabens antarcticus]
MIRNCTFSLIALFTLSICLGQQKEDTKNVNDSSTEQQEQQEQLRAMIIDSYRLFDEGKFRESLQNNINTIKKAEEAGDFVIAHAAYSYLGYDRLILEDTVSALKAFKKSYYYATKTRKTDLIADSYGDLAAVYIQNPKTYNKGIRFIENALEMYQTEGNLIGLQNSYYELATILFKRDDKEQFKQTLDSLTKYSLNSSLDERNKTLYHNLKAESHLKDNKIDDAIAVLIEAIDLGEADNRNDELEKSYRLYARALRSKENYILAYEMLSKYDSIYQINQKERSLSESKRIAAKFQVDEVQKDLDQAQLKTDLQAQKVQQRTLLNYMLIGVIVIGCAFIVSLIYIARKRKVFIESLEFKNIQVEKAKKEAERLSQVKSSFFSTVSHELRTPLYGVIGLTSILLEKNKDDENLQDLESLKFSADYLLALVNDVLQLNKIDSSKELDNNNEVFSIASLMENIISSFEYIRVQNNNEIKVKYDSKLPQLIKGNSILLSQVLMNLLGNACKFTEDGTIFIEIKVIKVDEAITLEFFITDTGQGIAENKINQIFEEFAQGESKNFSYQGTGLGLAIVKRLLHSTGSEIRVESEVGKGSTFSFQMNFEVVENSKPYDAQNEHTSLIYDIQKLDGCKILVVEDNKINQMVTRKILEKDNVHCKVAENGLIAVEMIRTGQYELVLMDVNMPVMDGLEATREIRTFSKIPIIALTAVELEEMREQIYSCGMDDIIVKPYDIRSFQQTIMRHLPGVESSLSRSTEFQNRIK